MTLIKTSKLAPLVLGLSALVLSACDDADDPFDCLINDRPVIDTDDMEQPVLNQVFDARLSVNIQNSSNDNDYEYVWTLTGDLPPGIAYEADFRDLNFSGTATSMGTYPYTVKVRVRDGDDDDDGADASFLCRDEVERDYLMIVEQDI